MEIDDEQNPNPNSTTPPPDSIAQIPPPEPPIPLLQTAFAPPIAPIPVLPPPPLAPIPSIRPPNVDTAKKPAESPNSDDAAADSPPEYEVSEESRLFREKQEKAKQEFLMKQRAAALAVPTNDKAVRSRLRRLGHPVTLFGEREMERRDRLRMIMARLDAEGEFEKLRNAAEEEEAAVVEEGGGEDEGEAVEYPFYTEGSGELVRARFEIAKGSVVRSAVRLERARRKRDDPDEDVDAEVNWALENAKSFGLDCSEIGDVRPLAGCSFSCDGKLLATWYDSFTY